jgi:HlyD family secretion protein
MMMARRMVGIAVALIVVGGLAWALWPRPLLVETASIDLQTIEVFVEEEGESRIKEVFTVSMPTSGRVRRLTLHAGDQVLAGKTVIAVIQPSPPSLLDARARQIAQAAVKSADAAVAFASAQLAQSKAQLEFQKAEAARTAALFVRGAVSARTNDKSQLDRVAAEAAVESAMAALDLRRRELESARAALIEGTEADGSGTCCLDLLAPTTGQVLRVLSESEQVLAAGTALVELGDPANLEILVDLLSTDAVRVTPGADATIDGWGGAPLTARVRRIDPSAFTRVSALGIEEQRVTVLLDLLGDPTTWRGLGDGYRVTARISLWRGQGLIGVPMGAIFRSGPDWAVYLAMEGRAVLRKIVLGEWNQTYAEVRSGLTVADRVILHPGDTIADGVAIAEEPAPR